MAAGDVVTGAMSAVIDRRYSVLPVSWFSSFFSSPHAARTWRMNPATARFRKADFFRTEARLARCLKELFLKSGSETRNS